MLERAWVPEDGEADIMQLDYVYEKPFNIFWLSHCCCAESKLIDTNQEEFQ